MGNSYKSSIGNRICDAFFTTNQTQISAEINVSQSTLSRYFQNEREWPVRILREVADKTGVTLDWLITGAAPKYPSGRGGASRAAESDPIYLTVAGRAAADDSGGAAVEFIHDEGEYIEIPPSIHVVEVHGNSMSPLLWDGQYALIDTEMAPREGDLAAVETRDGDTYIKRWHALPGTGDIILSSINNSDAQPPVRIPKDSIRQAYRIMGTWYGQ